MTDGNPDEAEGFLDRVAETGGAGTELDAIAEGLNAPRVFVEVNEGTNLVEVAGRMESRGLSPAGLAVPQEGLSSDRLADLARQLLASGYRVNLVFEGPPGSSHSTQELPRNPADPSSDPDRADTDILGRPVNYRPE